MSDSGKTTLSPKFMTSFNCIGSACEDTCCAGWNVDIDQDTYRKYQGVKDPELATQFKQSLVKRKDVKDSRHSASIKMSPTGSCPFLDSEKLCSIQKKLGPSFLSATCDVYPRIRSSLNDHYRFSATLSCPEAARLCVGSPDGMEIQELNADADVHKHMLQLFPNPGEGSLSIEDFTRRMVNNVLNDLVKDISLPIETTILVYGFMAQKFLGSEALKNQLAPPSLKTMVAYADDLKKALSGTDFNQANAVLLKLRILTKITVVRTYSGGNRFGELVKTASGAIFNNAADFAQATENYQRFLMDKFRPIDAQNPFAMRNYVLNYIFTNRSFVAGDPFKAFQELAFRFGVMKLLLIGLAGSKDEPLSMANYVTVISAVSRAFDHNAGINGDICAMLDQIEPNSIPATALLIQ